MPIYEYRCKRCEAEFEKYVAGAASVVACPTCQSSEVMRKLSMFGTRTTGAFQPSAMPRGGCCGGGCACQ